MTVTIGRLSVTVKPLRPPATMFGFRDFRGRIARELYKQDKRISQNWHCQTRIADPDPPIRSFRARTNLLFHVDGMPDRGPNADANYRAAAERLGRDFLRRARLRSGTALDTLLQRIFGSTLMTIPYDRLIVPRKPAKTMTLVSKVHYTRFLLTYPGIARRGQVILSIPHGVNHSRTDRGTCEGNVYTPLDTTVSMLTEKSEFAKIKPATREAKRAFAKERRERLRTIRARMADLDAERRRLEREIRELEGN